MPAPVIVSGIPRSGTSWVAKALSFASNYTYYREPDNADYVEGAQRWFRFRYLPEGVTDVAFAAHMTRAVEGEVATPATMAEDPGPLLRHLPLRARRVLGARLPALYFRRPGVLLKLVNCNLALEWFPSVAPGARQVVVLRHPCATFASWRRLGWEPNPRRLLDDERLVADHLGPHAELIEGASGFWESAGAYWGAITTVVTRQLERHPDWVPVQHEWLCAAPADRFRSLHAMIGLEWSDAAEEFLSQADRPGDTRTQSMRRAASDEIDKWKAEVAPEDQAACRRTVEPFELPWYPDFTTTVADPRWVD